MRFLGAVLAAVTLIVAPVDTSPAAHAADHHTIILTLIRHGESTANATGFIDTTVPGPDITPLGDMHRPSPWQINSAPTGMTGSTPQR